MSKKSGGDGSKLKRSEKKSSGNELRMSEYAAAQITEGAVIDFVFYEDFDADGLKEAVIGFTRFTPFPPDSAVLLIHKTPNGMEHSWLSTTDDPYEMDCCRTYDNAVAADTDGDGKPELVLSQVFGLEHDISVFIFDWTDEGVHLAWHSEKDFYHGSMEVSDIDGDEMAEIVIESGTNAGNDIIALNDACYRVREGRAYKWNGKNYVESVQQVRMPYESFNIAVDFISALWSKDYCRAFGMVEMPGFLGLAGLDDCSMTAFKSHIARKFRPVLQRNLSKGKLIPAEPYDTCCQFSGPEDCFTVELVRVKGVLKVYSLEIVKRTFE